MFLNVISFGESKSTRSFMLQTGGVGSMIASSSSSVSDDMGLVSSLTSLIVVISLSQNFDIQRAISETKFWTLPTIFTGMIKPAMPEATKTRINTFEHQQQLGKNIIAKIFILRV